MNNSSRLRLRSATHTIAEASNTSNSILPSSTLDRDQGENSSDDMDSNEGTDGSTKNRDSDSDDNQPLGSIFGHPRKFRTSRNIKRPRYNLSTDDENSFNEKNICMHKKNRNNTDSFDEENDDEDSQQNNQILSISSRGRVRKIKPNARCIFRKE